MRLSLVGRPCAASGDDLTDFLKRLRDAIAEQAIGDRTAFVNTAISLWSRMISLFRTGQLPARPTGYEAISGSSVSQLVNDANVRAASFGELGVALALLSDGQSNGLWQLTAPVSADLTAGALTSTGAWPGARPRAIFFVRSAGVAVDLKKRGAFANDNTVVIHADKAWHQLQPAGTVTARRPKRAPGRTGGPTTLHMSVAQLLDAEPDIGALRKRFAAEVTL
jgi:hypothetical protein